MFVFILALVATSVAAEVNHEVKLPPGKAYTDLENPEYPDAYSSDKPIIWKFESDAGSKILLKCDDFQTSKSDDCKSIHVEVNDGNSKQFYCGHYDALKAISSGNTLTVKLQGDGKAQATFSCFVKSTKVPSAEEVTVKVNKLYKFGSKVEAVPFFDQVWHFTAEEDYRVDLECYISLEEINSCYAEVLTVDIGDGPQEFCGTKKIGLFSKGNKATVRLELGTVGDGKAHCVAQAVGKNPKAGGKASASRRLGNEDSSEYVGAPGKKGTTCPCGWSNKSKSKIFYGKETAPNEFPWMVALRSHFSGTYAKCGGAIVTHRHVITAAHCLVNMYGDLQPFDPEKVHVYAGIHNNLKLTPKKTSRHYRAERTYVRPEFPESLTHDFAVIVLNESIEFSQTVGPICLSPDNSSETNKILTIMGWGKTEITESSDVLLKAKTTVLDSSDCSTEPWEICTTSTPTSTCMGDSGGPLVWLDPDTNRYTQISIVSYGAKDCVSTPSVSTHVAYFYDYLQSVIKETYPQEALCVKS